MERKRLHELESILGSITDGVFTVDTEWSITSFNRAAEKITGITRDEAIGKKCHDVFKATLCECGCALQDTLRTGNSTINKAIEIMSVNGKPIPISISTAVLRDEEGGFIGGVETFRDLTVVEELRKELEGKYTFYDIITRNHKMQQLLSNLPKIAESDSTCLIDGESGTGKELFAHAIHNLSPREQKPFVAVNCGALPDSLLESELFGYKKGAFTGAIKDKPGRFELAEGGTIFLDEIADISPAMQVKLLRVIQEKEYDMLGSVKSQKANVRIISATNKNIEKLIRDGSFRSDLYYRINVVRINLIPLRERRTDIMILANHFIDRLNRIRGREVAGLARETLISFMQYEWPGNVRELQNVIETAFIMCSSGLIKLEHLPSHFHKKKGNTVSSERGTLEEIEIRTITEALKHNNYKKIATAKELGINKTTLWRKIKKYNISMPAAE